MPNGILKKRIFTRISLAPGPVDQSDAVWKVSEIAKTCETFDIRGKMSCQRVKLLFVSLIHFFIHRDFLALLLNANGNPRLISRLFLLSAATLPYHCTTQFNPDFHDKRLHQRSILGCSTSIHFRKSWNRYVKYM